MMRFANLCVFFLAISTAALPVLADELLTKLRERYSYSWLNGASRMYLTNSDLTDLLIKFNQKDLKPQRADENEAIALLATFLQRYGAEIPFLMLDLSANGVAAYIPARNDGHLMQVHWTADEVKKIAIFVDRRFRVHQAAFDLQKRLENGTISVADAWCEVSATAIQLDGLTERLAEVAASFGKFVAANREELAHIANTDKPLHDRIVAMAHLDDVQPKSRWSGVVIPDLLTAMQTRAKRSVADIRSAATTREARATYFNTYYSGNYETPSSLTNYDPYLGLSIKAGQDTYPNVVDIVSSTSFMSTPGYVFDASNSSYALFDIGLQSHSTRMVTSTDFYNTFATPSFSIFGTAQSSTSPIFVAYSVTTPDTCIDTGIFGCKKRLPVFSLPMRISF